MQANATDRKKENDKISLLVSLGCNRNNLFQSLFSQIRETKERIWRQVGAARWDGCIVASKLVCVEDNQKFNCDLAFFVASFWRHGRFPFAVS
jgi:hypothetical protein